ncbi:uncharacterized protein [Oscarella lobularis]|uniref:uncharacterized protein n=1 Tax=Oscarella lobularis TaxID=121494 RepID=UPI003313C771
MDVDDVAWLTVDFPKESPSFVMTDLLKEMDTARKCAYSRQRQCIGGSPNIVVPTSINPSFVGFVDEQELEATLKVKWSAPAQHVSSCYHVQLCTREVQDYTRIKRHVQERDTCPYHHYTRIVCRLVGDRTFV